MIRLYFQQAFYHLRENPIITWVSVIGTALAICMIMVLVITLQVRMVDCEPEINRSRSLYVSTMAVRYKGTDHGAYGHMSVQTGKGCFKQLSTAEAVTLISLPEKVRVSLPAGAKLTADMVQTDEQFWHIFRFRFLSGKGFSKADSDAGIPCAVISATVARRLFGTTEATGQTLQLNHVDYRVSGVVADVSMLATSAYGQVWVPEAETFYRDQPDGVFANLYRKWDHLPDMKGIVLRYALVITILLLVPAINLSSMTLSRMRKRMSEIGVRKAFGATGSELVRQVFFENLLLSLLAGMLGLALSYGATFLLNGFLFGNSANAYLNGDTSLTPGMLLSPWAFLSAFGFCLLMNLLSAGIPAWRASRMNIVDAINQRGE